MTCVVSSLGPIDDLIVIQTPLGPTKFNHYREGVLWSGVYYTLCGLYLGFSKCPL